MDKVAIKDFWEKNPCGQSLVGLEGTKPDNFRDFFLKYDNYRYSTESHILPNLNKIDFKNKKVLEIGVGQAADAQQIIERGGIYYGIDMTQEACDRALLRFKIFAKSYAMVECADATDIPFPDDYFDIVYSHGVLHHIPDVEKVVSEIYRVLKKKGKIVIMVYAKKSVNYYLSILFMRRLLLLALLLVDKLTAGSIIKNHLLRRHLDNAKRIGLRRYLSAEVFLSKNTDGPENPYSRVYSEDDIRTIFNRFYFECVEHHFLNERHLPFFKVFPHSMKAYIAAKLGWHLWCYGSKG